MSHIIDGLFLGSVDDALAVANGLAHVDHVLTVAAELSEMRLPDDVDHFVIPLHDTPDQNLIPYLPAALNYIHAALIAGETILVHCHAGVSRSASIVIAYLVRDVGFTYPQAKAFVKNARPIIRPNIGFEQQLAFL